jgi:cell division protein FtsI/penicillin-binding protein 2
MIPRLRLPFLVFLLAVSRLVLADDALDDTLDHIAPELRKWATVCLVLEKPSGHAFEWHDYRETGRSTDFWPASTIKLYTAVAACVRMNQKGFTLDATVQFEHEEMGVWKLDSARTMREMLSEVFRRSSNEDYTLLLRLCGIDWLNREFLTPDTGFEKSALMRGYVKDRPWGYIREETQRLRAMSADRITKQTWEHRWSGHSYAAERGATIIDSQTGNVTTPRDLANCLRRLMFHAELPPEERFDLSQEQVDFLLHGGDGFTGLETKHADSGPSAWKDGLEKVFPDARFYHKCGLISDYALEVACVDDRANGGPCFILVPAIHAGHATKPVPGEKHISSMSRAIGEWVKARR